MVRGADLFFATGIHRLLQALLQLPAPVYHHHALLLDEHGRKLGKSLGATALRTLRANGLTPGGYSAPGWGRAGLIFGRVLRLGGSAVVATMRTISAKIRVSSKSLGV